MCSLVNRKIQGIQKYQIGNLPKYFGGFVKKRLNNFFRRNPTYFLTCFSIVHTFLTFFFIKTLFLNQYCFDTSLRQRLKLHLFNLPYFEFVKKCMPSMELWPKWVGWPLNSFIILFRLHSSGQDCSGMTPK